MVFLFVHFATFRPLKLLKAGVQVTAVRYHGTIHDFVMLNAITDDPSPRGAIEQASHMLKQVLSK
jgi:acetyl esterase